MDEKNEAFTSFWNVVAEAEATIKSIGAILQPDEQKPVDEAYSRVRPFLCVNEQLYVGLPEKMAAKTAENYHHLLIQILKSSWDLDWPSEMPRSDEYLDFKGKAELETEAALQNDYGPPVNEDPNRRKLMKTEGVKAFWLEIYDVLTFEPQDDKEVAVALGHPGDTSGHRRALSKMKKLGFITNIRGKGYFKKTPPAQ